MTAYRPDMLVRGVLNVSCGCVPGRGEVENASTFLASAVESHRSSQLRREGAMARIF